MTRLVAMAVAAGAVVLVAGCSGAEPGKARPPVPATVAELDPCTMLTTEDQAGLHLKVQDRAEAGPRRSCTFFSTDLTVSPSDQPRPGAIDILEITIRQSTAPNRAADAKRVAETYQRERQAKITTTKAGGRAVYQVGPAAAIGCPSLFQVDATSSVEVAATLTGGAPRCADPALTQLITAKLPAPNPTPPPADDRPADLLKVDPCTLLTGANLTTLHLHRGEFRDDVAPMCFYRGDATSTGALTSVNITIQTSGAEPPKSYEDYTGKVLTIGGRTAYEERNTETNDAMCAYDLEVTRATSVKVDATTVDSETIDKACRFAALAAADFEPRLPLIVT